MKLEEQPINQRFYLSTEGYYFEYRHDKYNAALKRATLFRERDNAPVSDILVSAWYDEIPAKTHTQVINHFESGLMLNKIK